MSKKLFNKLQEQRDVFLNLQNNSKKSTTREIEFAYVGDHIVVFHKDVEAFKVNMIVKTSVREDLIKIAKHYGLVWKNPKVNEFRKNNQMMSQLIKIIIDDFLEKPEIIKVLKEYEEDEEEINYDINSMNPELLERLTSMNDKSKFIDSAKIYKEE